MSDPTGWQISVFWANELRGGERHTHSPLMDCTFDKSGGFEGSSEYTIHTRILQDLIRRKQPSTSRPGLFLNGLAPSPDVNPPPSKVATFGLGAHVLTQLASPQS